MDTLAAVAIGVLSVIFAGSLLALVLICRQRYCGKSASDRKPILKYSRGDANGGLGGSGAEDADEVLQLSPSIQQYLQETDWVYDATGLVEHCLCILRSCHALASRLAHVSANPPSTPSKAAAEELGAATRQVLPRLDDFVRSLGSAGLPGGGSAPLPQSPPQAPNAALPLAPLLEARAAALVMAVSTLGLAFRAAFPKAKADAAWMRGELAEAHAHLTGLRTASDYVEAQQREASVHILYRSDSSGEPVLRQAAAAAAQPLPHRTGDGQPLLEPPQGPDVAPADASAGPSHQ